jgi:hypothetical protein
MMVIKSKYILYLLIKFRLHPLRRFSHAEGAPVALSVM